MEKKATVTRVDINDFLKELPESFPAVSELLAVIEKTPKPRQFAFEAVFPFGTMIIDLGKSCLLKPGYSGAEWKDSFRKDSAEKVRKSLEAECSKNTDHPLAFVLENEVEVYSWRPVRYTEEQGGRIMEELHFPLNRITPGGWFGTFGTNDIILAHEKARQRNRRAVERESNAAVVEERPWAAIAGRTCVTFNFPPPIPTSAFELRQAFPKLFPNADKSYIDSIDATSANEDNPPAKRIVKGFHKVVYDEFARIVRSLRKNTSTRILIIPDHYFLISKGEEEKEKALVAAKRELQRALLMVGWSQSEDAREALWRQRRVREDSDVTKHLGVAAVFNHLLDVVTGDGFCMRPITKDDGIIYEAWRVLCDRWTESRLWEKHCFPLMLTYDRGVPSSGLPALVLAQNMAENIAGLSEEDLKHLDKKTSNEKLHGEVIAHKLLSLLVSKHPRHGDMECTYYRSCIPMSRDLWEHFVQLHGLEPLASYTDRKGKPVVKVIRDGLLRMAKGGSFKAYYDNAFVVRRKVDV